MFCIIISFCELFNSGKAIERFILQIVFDLKIGPSFLKRYPENFREKLIPKILKIISKKDITINSKKYLIFFINFRYYKIF